MNIKQILKPTKSKLKLTAVLFLGVNTVHFALMYFFIMTAIVIARISGGFPISFYDINCGVITNPDFAFSNCRFHVLRFLSNILFWYGVVVIIKRNE